jgi:hypothetical protein
MKKLIVIAAIALSLAGCLGWPHWGPRYNRNRPQEDQRQEQRNDQHNRY